MNSRQRKAHNMTRQRLRDHRLKKLDLQIKQHLKRKDGLGKHRALIAKEQAKMNATPS